MARWLRWFALGLVLAPQGLGAGGEFARDYVLELAPETAADRVVRRQRLAERRAGPLVIVHRGAAAFAPENTLQAYASAMDHGADGVEVDVRRTADGVLVLFHDDTLERLTHGVGAVNEITARELLALEPRWAYGRPLGGTPPSFVQLLDLARQRAMLLHLDLKEPGLESEIARWLEAADCWDHVVAVNTPNATALRADPRLRPLLRYKAPGLYEGRLDLDPEAVQAALNQPGDMILVDDPRVAARVLGRPAYEPVPLVRRFLITRRPPPEVPAVVDGAFNAARHVAALAGRIDIRSERALVALLEAPVPDPVAGPEAATRQRARAARIVERAWAADRLGDQGHNSRAVVRALERVVRERTAHPDWRYHGLDAALAARALGRLGSTGSAQVLVDAFRRLSSEPEAGTVPELPGYPAAWAEARWRMHLFPALGDLRSRAARRFLREYVALNEAARAWGPPLFEEATRALLQQNVAWDEMARLLASPNPAVRGTALIECLDEGNEERRLALRAAAPWALSLPRARTLPVRGASPTPIEVPLPPPPSGAAQ
ncbi:MAG: glycerophosphodiester phosphodiesterase family protein [Verrucomicrobia bacterium]|nr:glycerophosphodiester phosphodiesterase family protein [Verrucomicrobiota bacterium]